jgi:hypothetical protein
MKLGTSFITLLRKRMWRQIVTNVTIVLLLASDQKVVHLRSLRIKLLALVVVKWEICIAWQELIHSYSEPLKFLIPWQYHHSSDIRHDFPVNSHYRTESVRVPKCDFMNGWCFTDWWRFLSELMTSARSTLLRSVLSELLLLKFVVVMLLHFFVVERGVSCCLSRETHLNWY